MKKKSILILVILSLAAWPLAVWGAAAPAATTAGMEFTLGGFIKFDSMWDSSVINKNSVSKIYRNNDPLNQHGRFRAMATGSRFNFTIKGPKLWGATLTGFLEADFDAQGATQPGAMTAAGADAADTGTFRLRHAMFRLNWPETELLMGQYWSLFSEWFPEAAADGAFHYRGANVYRPAQIRLTHKFLGAWTVAGAICTPRQGVARAAADDSEKSETPHFEGKVAYEQDLWGKAAYYGRPRGFVAQVVAGYQRTNVTRMSAAGAAVALTSWGQNTYMALADPVVAPFMTVPNHQTLDHWAVQGTLFIPVIPTYSANLAGSASLLTQWSLGQGQGFVLGTWPTDDAFLTFDSFDTLGNPIYKRVLTSSFTGFVQGQYYFTNEWFLNLCWGFMRNFGVGMDRVRPGGLFKSALIAAPVPGTSVDDLMKYSHQVNVTLWYQPVRALKFGLSYVFTQDHYMQRTAYAAGTPPVALAFAAPPGRVTDIGESHRIQFVGLFFF